MSDASGLMQRSLNFLLQPGMYFFWSSLYIILAQTYPAGVWKRSLSMANKTLGQANAGTITITASESVSFDGGDAFSTVVSEAIGDGGNINITTNSLSVKGNSQLNASTFGEGKAGNVTINARDRILIDGENSNRIASGIFSSVQSGGKGDGGNIDITTGSLSVTGGAQLLAATFGQGNAGNVTILARDRILFDGENSKGFPSGAFSTVDEGAVGNGGNITNQLTKAESLRQAQLALLQNPQYKRPMFWAPYVLVGNWL